MTRTQVGFDYFDRELDIVINPDLSEWRWKDEAEFQEAQDLRLIPPERAAELRAEGESVIRRLEARTSPFDQGWESWRPDPSWAMPTLTPGWDSLS